MSDLFTEEQLPRGRMLLVGRSPDGKEWACAFTPGRDLETQFKAMLDITKDLGAVTGAPDKV